MRAEMVRLPELSALHSGRFAKGGEGIKPAVSTALCEMKAMFWLCPCVAPPCVCPHLWGASIIIHQGSLPKSVTLMRYK